MGKCRVAVTGLGLVSPYGGDLTDFFLRLLNGESAIRFYQSNDIPVPLAVPFVSCPEFNADTVLGRALAGTMDRFAQLGTSAAFDAWQDAGFSRETTNESREDWGVSWGTSMGGTFAVERAYRELWQQGRERISPMSVVLAMGNAANAHISIQLGLGGVSTNHAVACASAAIAIGEAFRRVRSGETPVMLTGGSETPHSYGVVRAWEALRVVAGGDENSSSCACRPFNSDRSGLVLGEGGAALVLEDWDHAVARGARIHCEMVGYGTSCDHSHIVRPEMGGQVRALKAALVDASLAPDEIDYINAHGTATIEGDPIEIAALRSVFGERAAHLPVSATKSMHGHQLGAAGAIEAIVTILALREKAIPPTANLENIDPACKGVDHVTAGRRNQRLTSALSNSFAFGGSNAVLAFRAATGTN